ncbi:response regulator transcription factor [Ascidiimonas aurantiaca]|uniref:response regulator transcription factor n=1 Tax=Ascidiimonas aurantiaca TaxID=1685432 RepID=UPI0030ED5FF2
MKKAPIVIADDHPLLLKGLYDFLIEKGYYVCGMAENGNTAYNEIVKKKPAIAILDIQMPIMSGLEVAAKCKQNKLDVKIILITLHREKELLLEAKKLNIFGYVLKEFAIEEIEVCLQSVLAGTPFFSPKIMELLEESKKENTAIQLLTPSEKKILRYIASDKTNKEIADLLYISARTVEKHRSNIIQKLNLHPRINSLLHWAKDHKDVLLNQ